MDEGRPRVRELVQATLDLVRGLGLANTITDDTARRGRILARLGTHPRPGAERVMTDLLDQVLDDLAQEGAALDAMVAPLDEAGWRTPTPAAGWDVATQVAHLAWTDEVAVLAATDKAAWDARRAPGHRRPRGIRGRRGARRGEGGPGGDPLAAGEPRARLCGRRCARFPAGEKLPWFGPPMSPTSMATARFMETWAHAATWPTRSG